MKPSFKKFLTNDWMALFAALSIPGIWVAHLLFPLIARHATAVVWLPIALSLVCGVWLVQRWGRLCGLFAHGQCVMGVVVGLRMVRDRGRLEYLYETPAGPQAAWMAVHKSPAVMEMRLQQPVEVLFDPRKPSCSVVKSLFD